MPESERVADAKSSRPPPQQRAAAWVGGILIVLIAAVGIYGWMSLGDVEMSAGGYVAMAIGIVGLVGLGGGLMALIFYSHRHGYDDDVGGGPRDSG